MGKIFITGLTGLLGTNLAEDLLRKGFQVIALVRDISKCTELKHPNLQVIQGNLLDNNDPYFKDVDVFIHIAAETNQNLLRLSDYRKLNVDTTRHLFSICKRSGIKKFIFVSSANTMGYGSQSHLGNEDHPMKAPFTKSFYAQSKWEAEQFLLNNSNGIKTIILNPTFMLGNYDSKPSSGKIILMGWKKKIVFYPPGGKNFVAVKDVSDAIIKSIDLGESGERYLICNENLSYGDFFKRLNIITNQTPLLIKIPKEILITIGYFGDFLRMLKIKTSISSVNMKILCINNYFSNEKSINNLKINYQSIDKSISEAVDYFRKS